MKKNLNDDCERLINKYIKNGNSIDSGLLNNINDVCAKYENRFSDIMFSNRFFGILSRYNNSDIQVEDSIEKLFKVVEIMESSKGDYSKYYELLELYKTPDDLHDSYFDLVPLLISKVPNFVMKLYQAENFFRACKLKNSMIDSGMKYDRKVIKNNYNENYEYACFIINEYIKYSSDDINKFCYEYGIPVDVFEYCVKVVEWMNADLYNKFLPLRESRNKVFNSYVSNNIIQIFIRIVNQNGTYGEIIDFDVLSFFALNPLKYSDNFYDDFVRLIKKYPEEMQIVFINYLKENGLDSVKTLNDTSIINDYIEVPSLVDGIEVPIEVSYSEKSLALAYIRTNNLPLIRSVFDQIIKNIRNSSINLVDINYEEKQCLCTIIPTRKRSN